MFIGSFAVRGEGCKAARAGLNVSDVAEEEQKGRFLLGKRKIHRTTGPGHGKSTNALRYRAVELGQRQRQ